MTALVTTTHVHTSVSHQEPERMEAEEGRGVIPCRNCFLYTTPSPLARAHTLYDVVAPEFHTHNFKSLRTNGTLAGLCTKGA